MLNFIPQGGQIHWAEYELIDDVLKVTMNGLTEYFDFSGMPDGRAIRIVPEIIQECPIVRAERVNGKLELDVIYFYREDERIIYETEMDFASLKRFEEEFRRGLDDEQDNLED